MNPSLPNHSHSQRPCKEHPDFPKAFPSLALLELHFRATCAIKLPWYHGALWNALFRHLIRKFVDPVRPLSDLGFRVHPVETGCLAYNQDDPVHLGLSFPFALLPSVTQLIQGFNHLDNHSGRLGPATLRMTGVRCLVNDCCLQVDDVFPADWAAPLTKEMIQAQAEYLTQCQDFSLRLSAPLRLKAPLAWKKQTGYTYLDPAFFPANPHALSWNILQTI